MPSTTNQRSITTGLAVLSVLAMAYSLIIVQQILLGLLAVAALWGVYLFWRLVLALGRIASALERVALELADGGFEEDRTERRERTDGASTESAARPLEPER
ncbi:hypothetical protein [Haloarcula marina]|uniref:hypothetical protein n=1 Tax=Haloarcula marina TaxID=2961574 RepID=UPI0020B86855|nr:hypothetical protein [Halomicroarcula marina]